MKVYIAQMKVIQGFPEKNFVQIRKIIEHAIGLGAELVVFPKNIIAGSFKRLGCIQKESNFLKNYYEIENRLKKLSKKIKILVGNSSVIDGIDPFYYENGSLKSWNNDFEVLSKLRDFTIQKESKSEILCKGIVKKIKKPLIFLNPIGTENSGKNIYALDGGSCIYDKAQKVIYRMEQFKESEVFVEIKSGKIKILPNKKMGQNILLKSCKKIEPIAQIHNALVYMLRENLAKFHIERVVIGASGGIDSAVSAVLYSEAIGNENVYLVNMPTRFNSSTTKNAAYKLARNLKCPYMVVPISNMLEVVSENLKECEFERSSEKILVEGINFENLQARVRSSSVLLTIASVLNAGITCNGNKSEATVGYCTLYGDTCGVMCALGDLWKTQVYELASYINRKKEIIPKASIDIPASAELSDLMKVDEGIGDPIKYPYHDKLFEYWICHHGLKDSEQLLEKGALCKVIGADLKYFKKLFKTKKEALCDMRLWYRRFKGIALAKRLQFPPILSISGNAFGEEYFESQL